LSVVLLRGTQPLRDDARWTHLVGLGCVATVLDVRRRCTLRETACGKAEGVAKRLSMRVRGVLDSFIH
jgi:hypothetical protein